MGVTCQILINNTSEGFHRAGARVTGIAKYAIDVPTTYKDITLALKGISHCSWSETDSDENSTTYIGEETHVSQVVRLLDGAGTRTLPAGAYEHKFRFTLPKKIPPTFSRRTGDVSYKIALEFKKDRLFRHTKTFTEELTVRSYLDLAVPNTPIVFGLDKTLFKPLSLGNQKIDLKAVVAGPYVKPGEKAKLKFTITNDTSVNIKGIRAELIRHSTYTADCTRQYDKVKHIKPCTVETVDIPSRSKATMAVNLPTPDSEWTVQHSKVISNTYTILVTVRLPLPHSNATTMVPILLGEREEDIPIEVGLDIASAMTRDACPPQYNEAVETETRD